MESTVQPRREPDPQRILVVDDDEAVREGIAQSLRTGSRHYEVATAADGYRAEDMLHSFRPHLVILDLRMPGRSGLEVCKHIRELSGRHAVRIIILSAYPGAGHRERALLYDADLFLSKPQPIEALEEHIEDLLES